LKLCTFVANNEERIGAVVEDEKRVVDLNAGYAFYLKAVDDDDKAVEIANVRVPPDMIKLLEGGKSSLKAVHTTVDHFNKSKEPDPKDPAGRKIIYGLNEIKLSAPIPRPPAIFIDSWGRYEEGNIAPGTPTEPTHRLLTPSAAALCVIGNGSSIVFPKISKEIFSSVELGVVVGKRAWRVPLEEAEEYIAGYTIASDVTRFGLPGISGVRKEPL